MTSLSSRPVVASTPMDAVWQYFETATSWLGASISPNGRLFAGTIIDGRGHNETVLHSVDQGQLKQWPNPAWAIENCCSDAGVVATVLATLDGEPLLRVCSPSGTEHHRIPAQTYAFRPWAGGFVGVGLANPETVVVRWHPDSGVEVMPLNLVVTAFLGIQNGQLLLNGVAPPADQPPFMHLVDADSLAITPKSADEVALAVHGDVLALASRTAPEGVLIRRSRDRMDHPVDLSTVVGTCEITAVSSSGDRILVVVRHGLSDDLYLVDTADGSRQRINPDGTGTTGAAWFVDDDRSIVWVRTHPGAAPSLVRTEVAAPSTIRYITTDLEAPWQQSISVLTTDRPGVDALVLTPAEASSPQTVVIALHGGPRTRWRMKYDQLLQIAVAAGSVVVAPNCRGSEGRGADFAEALHGHWGDRDVADLLGVLTAVRRRYPGHRVVGIGQSYGSYHAAQTALSCPDLWDALVLCSAFASPESLARSGTPTLQASLQRQGALPSHSRQVASGSLRHLPVWILHSEHDPVVPASNGAEVRDLFTSQGAVTKHLLLPGSAHQPFEGSRRLHTWFFELLRSPDLLASARGEEPLFSWEEPPLHR